MTVRPKEITLERTDHNTSDELSITLDWAECGIDARLLDNARVTLYLGQANEFNVWKPGPDHCLFIGLVKLPESTREAETPGEMKLEAVDYTTLFINAKPFGSSGVPLYSDTLRGAWKRVCSQTPGADILAERLVGKDVDLGTQVGKGVAERFRKLGKITTKPDDDAWAVWQRCVGMLGLVSWIDLDQCIISTATNLYTEEDPPKLIWARNCTTWNERRGDYFSHKGVAVTSYDPLTATVKESFYPPIGDPRTKRKSLKALPVKKKASEAKALQNEDREWLSIPGVTEQAELDVIAQRVWEERSRQELSGHVETPNMETETMAGAPFDLLRLKAGDSISVSIEGQDRALLARMPMDERIQFLRERGYQEDVTRLIASNAGIIAGLPSVFITKTVRINMTVSREMPHFSIGIDYVNRISIDGSANP